jgi:hypothetical protein
MPFKNHIYGLRRQHPRKLYCNIIKFCLKLHSTNKPIRGLSINISNSGMCLYSPDRLCEGEEILIRETLPVKYRKAKVIWVKHYLAGLHKVGLKFQE